MKARLGACAGSYGGVVASVGTVEPPTPANGRVFVGSQIVSWRPSHYSVCPAAVRDSRSRGRALRDNACTSPSAAVCMLMLVPQQKIVSCVAQDGTEPHFRPNIILEQPTAPPRVGRAGLSVVLSVLVLDRRQLLTPREAVREGRRHATCGAARLPAKRALPKLLLLSAKCCVPYLLHSPGTSSVDRDAQGANQHVLCMQRLPFAQRTRLSQLQSRSS